MKKELKVWHPIIGYATIQLLAILNDHLYNPNTYFLFENILGWATGICLLVFLYTIIRDICRAIKTKINKSSDKTRRICEKVTPRKDKYATPPWEE